MIDDRCPECGCGTDPDADPKYSTWGGWDGFCGHLDCGACSILRAAKQKLWNQYAADRERYQRPMGTPAPEGGTALRSPFPGWLRNLGSGWNGLVNWRHWKATALIHERERKAK